MCVCDTLCVCVCVCVCATRCVCVYDGDEADFLGLVFLPLTTNQLSAALDGGTSKTCSTLRDLSNCVAIHGENQKRELFL